MSKTMSENRESLELNGVTFYFVRNEKQYCRELRKPALVLGWWLPKRVWSVSGPQPKA